MSKLGRRAPGVGLMAALVLLAGSGGAEAGLGIVVTDTTIMPVGDPLTELGFKLSLVANNELLQGDNLTLLDVPSFDGTARYVFTSGPIDYSQYFTIVAGAGSSAGLSNIKLVLTAAPPASLVNPDPALDLPIGELIVETGVEFPPSPGSPLFNPLSYTTRTRFFSSPGTPNVGRGITATPTVVVPEPASLALVGLGLGLAWAWPPAGRRWRPGRSA